MFAYYKKRIPVSFSKSSIFSPDQRSISEWLRFKLYWYESNISWYCLPFYLVVILWCESDLMDRWDPNTLSGFYYIQLIQAASLGVFWCLPLLHAEMFITYWEQWHEVWHIENYTIWVESNSIINTVLNWSSNTVHWPFAMSWFCENPIDVDVIFYSKLFRKESIILITVLACWAVRYYIQIFQLFQVKWYEDLF